MSLRTPLADAFALASADAGRGIGPGPLSIDGALASRSARDVVLTCVLEGCIGETVAALEASEALENATDAAVQSVLSRVARDETRHAELAYRFVRWALEASSPHARAELSAEILELVARELACMESVALPRARKGRGTRRARPPRWTHARADPKARGDRGRRAVRTRARRCMLERRTASRRRRARVRLKTTQTVGQTFGRQRTAAGSTP